jgi:glycerate-2-kinase/ubiquinone/menaquinone biosynthesis C-methylase UbiE
MSLAELKQASRRIMRAALAAADPAAAVRGNLSAAGRGFTACGREYGQEGRLILVAAGKAAAGMAGAALEILGARVSEGIVVVPQGYPKRDSPHPRVDVLEAGHPIPNEQGLAAARRVVGLTAHMRESDVLLFLLSGGGSSLLPLPYPPLSLRDKMDATSLLLKSGASIREINTVRTHLSAIKGGRLAAGTRGTIVTLAISDVVGDQVAFISSGPTVPDPTTFADAAGVLARYGLFDKLPASVRALIEEGVAGKVPDTPKAVAGRFPAAIVASSSIAVEAAAEEARRQGFPGIVLTTFLEGEAREAGRLMASVAREVRMHARPAPAPVCIFAAGETTVTVRGNGKGGRNQEIALAAALALRGETGLLLTSFATDGRDGNTDAAGAYASGETIATGRREGLDPHACLAANDTHAFLSAAGDLIVTGPTGTNVNDITFVLIEKGSADPHFDTIYRTRAHDYHELVSREDAQGNLLPALLAVADVRKKTVIELGAGTGRVTRILAPLAGRVLAFDASRHMLDRAAVYLAEEIQRNVRLAVADNRAVPLPDASAEIVVEGWSFGHSVTREGDDWRNVAEKLLAETMRLVKPGGTVILIETLGTGHRTPHPPGTRLPLFFSWLQEERGFALKWIRTDYLFESLGKARELVEFFFGQMVEHEVLPSGQVVVPECTGIWWKVK